MPTRAVRKAYLRSNKANLRAILNAWEAFLRRHRTNEPSTRKKRRLYCLMIHNALANRDRPCRPQDLTPAHARIVLRDALSRDLSSETINTLRSTLRWLGRVLDRPLLD